MIRLRSFAAILFRATAFPYRTASGGVLDSGNYQHALERGTADGGLSLISSRGATRARAEGRLYGVGYTAVVEPSVSNMGYITTALTAEERRQRRTEERRAVHRYRGVRSGRLGHSAYRLGAAGPGPPHRRVADRRRCAWPKSADIRVITELDTARDAWSIASGNYSSRFARRGRRRSAARCDAHKGQARNAPLPRNSMCRPIEVEFVGGRVRARGNPDNALPFGALAATSHWSPGVVPEEAQALRETVFWSPPSS